MSQINPSVQSFFDGLASEIQSRLLQGHAGGPAVRGDAGGTSSDLIWWSWSLSIDPGCRVLVGASLATWRGMGGIDSAAAIADFGAEFLATLTEVIQDAARSRFGSEVTCSAAERSEEAPREWTSPTLAVKDLSGADIAVQCSISPDLQALLGGSTTDAEVLEKQDLAPRLSATKNSADILMHVEMPVTIVLGRTTMRIKDLLKLTNGSVVELDQVLNDEVEIRVNNCVIAYGEVVAVDGNYAVRILRMAPARDARNLRAPRTEKAA